MNIQEVNLPVNRGVDPQVAVHTISDQKGKMILIPTGAGSSLLENVKIQAKLADDPDSTSLEPVLPRSSVPLRMTLHYPYRSTTQLFNQIGHYSFRNSLSPPLSGVQRWLFWR